jgi:hypothetical protein
MCNFKTIHDQNRVFILITQMLLLCLLLSLLNVVLHIIPVPGISKEGFYSISNFVACEMAGWVKLSAGSYRPTWCS